MARLFLLIAALAALPCIAQAADFFTLKGHGGPIMGIAVSPQTGQIASASFDNSVGLWNGGAPTWLEAHDAAANVVAFLGEDAIVSAGDDFSVIVWDRNDGSHRRLEGHRGKVVDLALSPDAQLIASASWDGSIGLWPVAGGKPRFLNGHTAGVNAVAFSRDGERLYSASADGTIRLWDIAAGSTKRVLVRNGFGINEILLGGHGENGAADWLAYGTVDGVTRIIDLKTGQQIMDFTLDRRPILALALDAGGKRLASGDGHGYISIIDVGDWRIERDFRAALKGPIWALAFSPDGGTILAGGIENIIYAWPIDSLSKYDPMAKTTPSFLKKPEEMGNGERQFVRKCSICHSLTEDGGRKAGPTLFEIFGRKAGSLPDYNFSERLAGSDLVWNEQTIDLLFDLGPDHYIPGSKMPMQRIAAAKDRRDLVEFLKQSTQ